MTRIINAAQLVPVRDLAASVAFYTDLLGCEVVIRAMDWQFVTVRREGLMLGLQGGATPEAAKITAENLATQVWVRDLPGLWTELSPALESLAKTRIRAPFRQPYGVHEFHVKDPDGFLILFAEANDTDLAD